MIEVIRYNHEIKRKIRQRQFEIFLSMDGNSNRANVSFFLEFKELLPPLPFMPELICQFLFIGRVLPGVDTYQIYVVPS